MRGLPPFPVEALPAWLAAFVRAEATATQTPPDLAALLAMAALAAVSAGRVEVEARVGWREPLNIFTAVGLPPGARKSAVFAHVTAPLTAFERAEAIRLTPLIVEAMTTRKIAEKAAEQAKAIASKAKDDERDAAVATAVNAAQYAESIDIPPAPRLLADDATPEALAGLLAEHGRIALMSAEGGTFDIMAGRYGRDGAGPNLDVYLKGHAGDSIRVDRRGRPPEHIERPALTVGLAIQPDVLRMIADRPGFRGRGLLARFWYALPVNTVGRRQVAAPPVSEAVADAYATNLQILARSLAGSDDPVILVLEGEFGSILFNRQAGGLLLAFEEELEPRLDPETGDLAHIADWAGKLAGAAVRIAGLLHLAEHVRGGWTRPISAHTMRSALVIARYLIDHALAVFDLMGADPLLSGARLALAWIERTGKAWTAQVGSQQSQLQPGSFQFSKRELFRALPRSNFSKVTDLDPVLDLLEAHGYIHPLPPPALGPSGGRPGSPLYEVTPFLTDTTDTTDTARGSGGSVSSVSKKAARQVAS